MLSAPPCRSAAASHPPLIWRSFACLPCQEHRVSLSLEPCQAATANDDLKPLLMLWRRLTFRHGLIKLRPALHIDTEKLAVCKDKVVGKTRAEHDRKTTNNACSLAMPFQVRSLTTTRDDVNFRRSRSTCISERKTDALIKHFQGTGKMFGLLICSFIFRQA